MGKEGSIGRTYWYTFFQNLLEVNASATKMSFNREQGVSQKMNK